MIRIDKLNKFYNKGRKNQIHVMLKSINRLPRLMTGWNPLIK